MGLIRDKNAQLHTIEGISAAVLMVITLYFVTQSAVVVTPQTELSIDAQLKQIGNDVLTVLDSEEIYNSTTDEILLKRYVANWSGAEADIISPVPNSIDIDDDGENDLNATLYELLPDNVMYNVDFVYVNGTGANMELNKTHVIKRGAPVEDSVVVSRLVTIHWNDEISNYWNLTNMRGPPDIKVIEVRLILWYL
ncbi:MAG: hypothetical protein SVM80_03775 [Halobacteriota archaeon]|nr:hypothetical protein [Halobacteriota archaeon]